jgi:hypothetical protein
MGNSLVDYEVYIHDTRYLVPSLYLISASSVERALKLAEQLWRESPHHRGVEVRQDGARIAVLGTLAEAQPNACDCG